MGITTGSNEREQSREQPSAEQLSSSALLSQAAFRPTISRAGDTAPGACDVETQKKLDAILALPKTDRLKPGEVLWDVAGRSLLERAKITGEPTDRDSRYREVNRIMVNSGFQDARLEGKKNISDRDLPNSWNSITNRTKLTIYTEAQLQQIQEDLRKRCEPPVAPPADSKPADPKPGEGSTPVTPTPGDGTTTTPPATSGDSGGANQVPPAGGADQTPPGGGVQPAPIEATKPDYSDIAAQLRKQHDTTAGSFSQSKDGQGIIGRLFDGAKNSLGTANDEHATVLGKLWSNVLDSNVGSDAINQQLQQQASRLAELEKAAKAGDEAAFAGLYQQLTGQPFDPSKKGAHNLPTNGIQERFEQSQSMGVETITDISAALAAVGASRFGAARTTSSALKMSMGGGFVLGAGTKAGLKQIDGRYADLQHDLITGGIWGMTVPMGEIAGASVSRAIGNKYGLHYTGNFITGRLETQGAGLGLRALSAAAKSGTSGTVFGATDGAVRTVIEDVKAGRQIDPMQLAQRSLIGAGFGFVGGTLLGLTADGLADGFRRRNPTPVAAPEAKMVNGVEVPTSGVSSIDDAAKMMGSDAQAFAKKAANDPYGAVVDAAKLYDDTGVNIRKHTPNGELAVPPQFAEALGIVQTVDAATPGSKLSLGEKIPVIKSADEFVTGPKAPAVNESLEKIRADQNFQEVMRLTAQQRGDDAALALREKFEQGLTREIKTGTATEQLNNAGNSLESSFSRAQAQAEAAYLQKAADFFKDMTDPAQRARLNELVDDIFEKFTPRPITRPQLDEIVQQFTPEQQPYALALLERSAANSSDVGIRVRMQAIKHELESITGSGIPSNVYTLSPDSSGNLLGYLFRKSNSSSMSIRNIDALAADISAGQIPSQIVLFDDLARTPLTAEQKALLAKVPKVYVVDLGAFEKGINVVDMASGPAAVAAKLKPLVEEAQHVAGANRGLIPSGAAQEVLDRSVDRAAASIGENVHVVRPSGNWHSSNAPTSAELAAMDPLDAVYARMVIPKASKEEIATFLSGYAGADRELAARMLAEGSVHNSFPAIIANARKVNEQIESILAASGAQRSDFLMVVDKDPGGSTHLVSYLFGRANQMQPGNYISARGLNEMIANGTARGKVVAYMDDTIYSGSQASNMLDSNISSFMPFRKVIVGGLGAYDKGLNAIGGTHLSQVGKATVAVADRYQPFYSTANPFFGNLDAAAQARVRGIGGYEGFGQIQGSQIWAYMYPDNNLNFFGPQFAGSILRLPGP